MKNVNADYFTCDPDDVNLQYLLLTLPPCRSQEPFKMEECICTYFFVTFNILAGIDLSLM
jgi:hypothetical protein